MQIIAVEETALTKQSNEQETTAFVPTTTEQDVIEGEAIVIEPPEPSEDHISPQQKPYWLLDPFTVLACLAFAAVSSLIPFLIPSATVTIIPVEQSITATTAITVQARALAPLTLSQRATVPATGILHQAARRARGTITWYNGQFASLTIPAGTMVPGTNGVRVITDQAATIPPGNPPIYGHVTVPAHAIVPGTTGNIPAFAINQACCAPSVFAKNTQAFTGGRDARDIAIVTRTDIANATAMLKATLTRSLQAAVQAQLNPGEALILTPATMTIASNHQAGDAAAQVYVTMAITCTGIAYADADVNANATQALTSQASYMLGADYAQLGDIHVTSVHATTIHIHQGRINLVVQLSGTWVYHLSPGIRQQLVTRIAGKTRAQAEALLLTFPGIAEAQIAVRGGNQTLPLDAHAIRILVRYTADHNQMRVNTPKDG